MRVTLRDYSFLVNKWPPFLFLQLGTQQHCGILLYSYATEPNHMASLQFVYVCVCPLSELCRHCAVWFRLGPMPHWFFSLSQNVNNDFSLKVQRNFITLTIPSLPSALRIGIHQGSAWKRFGLLPSPRTSPVYIFILPISNINKCRRFGHQQCTLQRSIYSLTIIRKCQWLLPS